MSPHLSQLNAAVVMLKCQSNLLVGYSELSALLAWKYNLFRDRNENLV